MVATEKKKKNRALDIFKLIAAFGVIAAHVNHDTVAASTFASLFTPFRVPYFILVSMAFFLIGISSPRPVNHFSKIFHRLVVPYLSWTLIYTVILHLRNQSPSPVLTLDNWWELLLYGKTTPQMYFIPLLISYQLILYGLFHAIKRRLTWIAVGCLAAGLLHFFIGVKYEEFAHSLGGLLVFCVFVLVVWWTKDKITKPAFNVWLLILGLVAFVVTLYCSFYTVKLTFLDYHMINALGGISVFLICIGRPIFSVSQKIIQASTTSYGIYLSHFLFIWLWRVIVGKVLKITITYDLFFMVAMTSFVFICSYLFVVGLQRQKWLARLLLGVKEN
ncbi:acyltransferase family protein [Parapedobacter sp. DT-150]|uniref:acyltransferase family protein n=1 Tax=Parapedobacter sp. DT-150 TaxID=3396162 RepID=UPI003F1CF918